MRTARADHRGGLATAVIQATAVAFVALMVGCADDGCDFTKIRDHPSPDGRMVLTSFEYCCYDTTGYDTQLHLRRRGEKLPTRGNVRTLGAWAEFTSHGTPSQMSLSVFARQCLSPQTSLE